ncbi:MAG: transglycosylase SLT domain-containing protein [Azospirillaceae bacterium]
MQTRLVIAIVTFLTLVTLQGVRAQSPITDPSDNGCAAFIDAAEIAYEIPRGLLMAIGVAESRLTPLAVNRSGRTYTPASYNEAAALLRDASGQPHANVSVGCMQIFARVHLDEVDGNPAAFLDPATNVDYAARLLVFLHEHTGSWRDAVGRYHAGPTSPNFERYICAIDRQVQALGGAISLGCGS